MRPRIMSLTELINGYRHTCMGIAALVTAQGRVPVKGFLSSFLTKKMGTHHTHLDCTRSAPCHGTTIPSTIPFTSKQKHVKNGHMWWEKLVKNAETHLKHSLYQHFPPN